MLHDSVLASIFDIFWRSLTASSRGDWNEPDLGRGRAECYRDSDILARKDFLQPHECNLLIALAQSCEGFMCSGPVGSTFDLVQMKQVISWDAEYQSLDDLLDVIPRDMRHVGAQRSVDVLLMRRYLQAAPAQKRSENSHVYASRWLLWLNDDYSGGELFFPTRRIALRPKAGTIVRWPEGIPCGVTLAHEGYQFTLSGGSV